MDPRVVKEKKKKTELRASGGRGRGRGRGRQLTEVAIGVNQGQANIIEYDKGCGLPGNWILTPLIGKRGYRYNFTGKTRPLPQYGSFISRIFLEHFHTTENISILWN